VTRFVADMVWPISTCGRYRLCLWPIWCFVWPTSSVADIVVSQQGYAVSLKFNTIPAPVTRGNTYKIRQDHVRYDLRKFSFSNRVRTLWNSLPDIVVKAESVNSFKTRLDSFWDDKEVKFNWKADIKGTGSRSNSGVVPRT